MLKKHNILGFCLCISFVPFALLSWYITEHESRYENMQTEHLNQDKCLIPNEETAEKIAATIIEANGGFEEGWIYEPSVELNLLTNEWEVFYLQQTPDKTGIVLDSGGKVCIDRDTGMITGLYLNWAEGEDVQ